MQLGFELKQGLAPAINDLAQPRRACKPRLIKTTAIAASQEDVVDARNYGSDVFCSEQTYLKAWP